MGAFKSGELVERVKSLWEENVIISMDFFFFFAAFACLLLNFMIQACFFVPLYSLSKLSLSIKQSTFVFHFVFLNV